MTEVSPTNKWIGARIRSVRIAHNKTQADLGEVLGVTHAAISDIETGKTLVKFSHLIKIVEYFKMNIKDFIPKLVHYDPSQPITITNLPRGAFHGPGGILEKPTANIDKVKIISDGTWASTHIMVGNKELHVNKLEIDFSDGRAKARMEIYVDFVDVEALQKDTELIIKEME